MLRHERLGELELRLHDLEPILLEHELRGTSITELLALAHERSDAALEDGTRHWRGLPQLHMLQFVPGIGWGPPPEGWTGRLPFGRETAALLGRQA